MKDSPFITVLFRSRCGVLEPNRPATTNELQAGSGGRLAGPGQTSKVERTGPGRGMSCFTSHIGTARLGNIRRERPALDDGNANAASRAIADGQFYDEGSVG